MLLLSTAVPVPFLNATLQTDQTYFNNGLAASFIGTVFFIDSIRISLLILPSNWRWSRNQKCFESELLVRKSYFYREARIEGGIIRRTNGLV